MVNLSSAQKAKVAASIRAQYRSASKFVPPKVARARALKLVLEKSKQTKKKRD